MHFSNRQTQNTSKPLYAHVYPFNLLATISTKLQKVQLHKFCDYFSVDSKQQFYKVYNQAALITGTMHNQP